MSHFFPLCPPLPSPPPAPRQSPHCCPCPWVIHTCSLVSPFLFFLLLTFNLWHNSFVEWLAHKICKYLTGSWELVWASCSTPLHPFCNSGCLAWLWATVKALWTLAVWVSGFSFQNSRWPKRLRTEGHPQTLFQEMLLLNCSGHEASRWEVWSVGRKRAKWASDVSFSYLVVTSLF